MSDAVVWRKRVSLDANPVMTIPIKKRINTELFIDRTAALYIAKWSDQECGEGGQPLVLGIPYAKSGQKMREWATNAAACFEMCLTGKKKRLHIIVKISQLEKSKK